MPARGGAACFLEIWGPGEVFPEIEGWALPTTRAELEACLPPGTLGVNPWPQALAMEAALLLNAQSLVWANVVDGPRGVNLSAIAGSEDGIFTEHVHFWWSKCTGQPYQRTWTQESGCSSAVDTPSAQLPELPTLAEHLDRGACPVEALLLALWDVPAIRTRAGV
jgi:hypothetical protein